MPASTLSTFSNLSIPLSSSSAFWFFSPILRHPQASLLQISLLSTASPYPSFHFLLPLESPRLHLILSPSLQLLAFMTWLPSFDTAVVAALSFGRLDFSHSTAQKAEMTGLSSYSPSVASSGPCLSHHLSSSHLLRFNPLISTPLCIVGLLTCSVLYHPLGTPTTFISDLDS